ncbi:hypothetical protein ACFL54_05440, partial [Planctomycetota bacterium]
GILSESDHKLLKKMIQENPNLREELAASREFLAATKQALLPESERTVQQTMKALTGSKNLQQVVEEPGFDSRELSSNKKVLMFFAIAAGVFLLLGLGFYWVIGRSGPGGGGSDPDNEIVRFSAEDKFYVFCTEPANQAVLVQVFSSFEMERHNVGSSLGVYQLVGLDHESLDLKENDGSVKRILVSDFNADAINKLKEETNSMQKRFTAGQLTSSNVDRLQKIAFYWGSDAHALLETVADSSSPLREKARQILNTNWEMASVRNLIHWAKTADKGFSLQAIRSLGDIRSPLALQCIHEIALDSSEEEISLFALEVLNNQEPSFAAGYLDSVASKAKYLSVRQQADLYLQSILKELEK